MNHPVALLLDEEGQGHLSVDFNLHNSDDDSSTYIVYRTVGESNDLTELDNLCKTLKK